MLFTRLIYSSAVCRPQFNDTDIEQILGAAKRENTKHHITGLLCFNRKYFLQCLEGPRAALNTLYHRIATDKRHDNITLISVVEIDRREFGDWAMGYVPESSLSAPTLLRYAPSPEFEPFRMSAASSLALMTERRNTVRVV